MNGATREDTGFTEMLSFGGSQFASNLYMAFTSYYLLMFCTDIALIPPAVTAALLLCHRLFAVANSQATGLYINRVQFKDGKYRPYFKWCALPYAAGLAALGLTPRLPAGARLWCVAFALLLCELSRTALYTASMAMLPYIARDDKTRTKFVSFSNSSAILAYIVAGTFMLPLAGALGGGDRGRGFAPTLALFALVSLPLNLNAYRRVQERHYGGGGNKPAVKDILLTLGRNSRLLFFLAGYGIYSMANTCRGLMSYYYIAYHVGRPDLLPVIILAGLVSPLAAQPVIPRLLAFAKKETLILFGLFASSGAVLLIPVAGRNPAALIACAVLYGAFTAIAANLVFTVTASFSDEIRAGQNMQISEILTAALGLSSHIGAAAASAAAPAVLAAFGYAAQAAMQSPGALAGIEVMFVYCTAAGLALAGLVMLLFARKR